MCIFLDLILGLVFVVPNFFCFLLRIPTPPPPPRSTRSNAMVRAQPRALRVNNVTVAEAHQSSEIVLGRLLVNSVPATVLFDSGASHSFVSQRFADEQVLTLEDLPGSLSIVSPGSKMASSLRAPFVRIEIQGCMFPTFLILLPRSDIDCPSRLVRLTHDSGAEIWYTCGSTAGSAQLYALNAGVAPLIEEVRIVCEFSDVFPEELPGIPPVRAIEFVIELEPGTQPISRHPYKMCPEELIELKE